jgi:hypothetical protein
MNPSTEPKLELPRTPKEVSETLQDGNQMRVTFEDPARAPEWVRVRKIPRNEFVHLADAIMNAVHDEYPEAACYCGKTPEWAQALTDESFEAVMQEGRRLNFSRFRSWFERRQDVLNLAKVQAPALKKIQETVESEMRRHSRNSTSS